MIVNGKNVRVRFDYLTGENDPDTHRPIRARGEGVLTGYVNCGTLYRGVILADDYTEHMPRVGQYKVIGLGDLKPTNT